MKLKSKLKFKLNKKLIVFLLPFLVVAITVTSFVLNPSPKDDFIIDVVDNSNQVNRKVYLITKNSLVVPLTVSFAKKDNLVEDVFYVMTLLRAGSPLVKGDYQEVFSKDTKINNIKIENKVVELDVSPEFANYSASKEIRILEALVWTLTQYDEIQEVTLKVGGETLQKMPVSGTPIPAKLSKNFGINNQVFGPTINTKNLTVFYQTVVDSKTVFVPVTKRINASDYSVASVLPQMKQNAPIYTGLITVSGIKSIEFDGEVSLTEDNILEVGLGVSALIEENSVSKEIYDLIVMSFSEFETIKSVVVKVNDEETPVSGYDSEKEIPVGSIIFNEFKF